MADSFSRSRLIDALPNRITEAASNASSVRPFREVSEALAADPARGAGLFLKYMFERLDDPAEVKRVSSLIKDYAASTARLPKPPPGFCKRPRDGSAIEVVHGGVTMRTTSPKRWHEAKTVLVRLLEGEDSVDAIRALFMFAWMHHLIAVSGVRPGRLPQVAIVQSASSPDRARILDGARSVIAAISECEPSLSALREAFALVKNDLKLRRDEAQALTDKKLGTHGLVLRLAFSSNVEKYKVQTDPWDDKSIQVLEVPSSLEFVRVRPDGLTKVAGAPYTSSLEADAVARLRELQSGDVNDVHALVKKVGVEALKSKSNDENGLLSTLEELLDGDADAMTSSIARALFGGDVPAAKTAIEDVLLTKEYGFDVVPAYYRSSQEDDEDATTTRFARAASLADHLGMAQPFIDWLAHRWTIEPPVRV